MMSVFTSVVVQRIKCAVRLRQSLHQLRKLLGDLDEPGQSHLLVTRQAAQFNPESNYELDVQQFLQAAEIMM